MGRKIIPGNFSTTWACTPSDWVEGMQVKGFTLRTM